MHDLLDRRLNDSLAAIGSLREQLAPIISMGQAIMACFQGGGTLYTCGNGGSAAQALHLAEELIGRYRTNRRPWPAVCLNADPTALTCIANDFGFDEVFARQCEALLQPGDVLLALSTSGQSENIGKALRAAQQKGARTLGLLGKDGGRCKAFCDEAVIVNHHDSAFIQDAHQVLIHLLCEMVESASEPPGK